MFDNPWWAKVFVAVASFIKSNLMMLAIAMIGMLLSYVAYRGVAGAEDARVISALSVQAYYRTSDIQVKLGDVAQPVEDLAVFIAAQDTFRDEQFDRFTQLIDQFDRFNRVADAKKYPLSAIRWATVVQHKDRAAFEQSTGLMITERRNGRDSRAENRSFYLPIVMEKNFDDQPSNRGLDGLAEPNRYNAIIKASEEGRTIAIPIQSQQTHEFGYYVFVPVYAGATIPATIEERRATFRGVVIGYYRMKAVLTARFAVPASIDFMVAFDGIDPVLVARYDNHTRTIDPIINEPHPIITTKEWAYSLLTPGESSKTVVMNTGAIQIVRNVNALGVQWNLWYNFEPNAVREMRSSFSENIVLILGLSVTLLVGGYLFRERQSRAALTEEFTVRLQAEKELQSVAQQLVQSQKMEAIGQLAGGMAHDFNNILGIIIGNLDLISEEWGNSLPEIADAIQAALTGADLVRRLLGFARRQPLLPKRIYLDAIINDLVPLLRRTIGGNIDLQTVLAEDAWPVLADQGQFENATLNLVINARDAMPNGGVITIEAGNRTIDEDNAAYEVPSGNYCLVSVSDTGTGMSKEVIARVFEPFFTTKAVGSGTGLGLSMVFGFLKQSGGSVKLYSELGHGTTVKMYFPRHQNGEIEEEAEQRELADAPTGTERIMVIEDMPSLRDMAVRLLTSLGYEVIEADNAAKALAMLDAGVTVDLMFSDIVMPGTMNGLELARIAQHRFPTMKIVLTSGFSANIEALLPDLDADLITKPYRKIDLAKTLRTALDRQAKSQSSSGS